MCHAVAEAFRRINMSELGCAAQPGHLSFGPIELEPGQSGSMQFHPAN